MTSRFPSQRSRKSKLSAGLIGKVFFNWLDAELVWVEKAFRGSGIGRHVLQIAEQTGRNWSLTGIYLRTQSWQAPGFYRKLGFEQFAEFDNFPPGHKRLGCRKYLIQTQACSCRSLWNALWPANEGLKWGEQNAEMAGTEPVARHGVLERRVGAGLGQIRWPVYGRTHPHERNQR